MSADPMSADPMLQHMPSELEPWLPGASPAEFRQLAIESLRWQAQEIIDELLCEDDPGGELARARLRRCVERNPGRPERALLEQLMARPPGTGQD